MTVQGITRTHLFLLVQLLTQQTSFYSWSHWWRGSNCIATAWIPFI